MLGALLLLGAVVPATAEPDSSVQVEPESLVADAGVPVEVDAGAPVEPGPPVVASAPAEPFWKKAIDATGYVDSRSTFTRGRTWGFIPTDDVPQLQELVELNTQVKVSVRPRTFAYSDVSLVATAGGFYRGRDATGQDVGLPDHSSSQVQPVVSLNELYALHEFRPELNVLVGRKRIVWGSGVAYNPTDFLNARRDPTDPTFQRSGAWLAQVEVPLESMTFSAYFAPAVLEQASGIPTQFLTWPSWDERDTQAHFQLGARAYALVADADLNLMLFFGNRYNDEFEKKLRVGFSFSRYFFTDYELHVEALFQSGSPRDFIEPACVESQLAALACATAQRQVVVRSKLNDSAVLPRVLVGTRRQFSDDSMLSLEYLFQADGWAKSDFTNFASGLDLLDQGRRAGLPVNRIPGAASLLGAPSQDGLPSRFSFDPRAQHYLFASYQKPRIHDDFTAQLVLIANLQDLSTLWTPSLAWSATDWLTLTLFAFLPLPGPDSLAPKTPGGRPTSEYGTLPFATRVLFEARAFF